MTEYRNLGSTGLRVSPLTLGTMMFGAIGNPDHEDSIRIIHRALESGINLVDTADVYSKGESEVIVGKALKGRRDDVVLATKVHGRLGEDVNQAGNSRRWIIREVEDSLRRLQTDWIDLYQVHRPEPDTDIDETLGALTDLVRQGKIRYIGTSTFDPGQIVEAQYVARERHRERPVTEQPPYSILARGVEREVLPLAQRHRLGVLPWSPLAAAGSAAGSRPTASTPPPAGLPGSRSGTIRRRQKMPARRRRCWSSRSSRTRPDCHSSIWPSASCWSTRRSPPRSSGRGRWITWRGHSARTRWACQRTCWTGSTRSSRPAPP